ncbi:NAD(P)-dependent oxidoreductase [Actinoplanes awajinensis]|uniref:6-phosphogluconate dehydrogenase NADP-binding domain-containing protein n=1 Tax=Actinoplanes awajinensis subsp. mycoplanecinus TaxID=135947 RepID=A0A101JTZ2_9ACTN|nr:NAD(P)-dependent oxidoreductase [Actinoplanes awajinensis]KUL33001.1 hypothetical protein ADL15_18455 [Actinoplanes awajinensis subsp. mycoplanecinus]
MTAITVLGTGRMGTALAIRLYESGHQVTIWNRDQSRTTAAAATGAKVATTPAEAVAAADLVITMLTDARAVEAVLFGTNAAVAALRPGTVLVQMSTIGPVETTGVADRLPDGVHFVDAPVGGSVDAAAAGTLVILAGGTSEALQRAEPVLHHLGTVRRCGAAGAASSVKLMLNTAMLTALGALHDTLLTAEGLGINRAVAAELLTAGPLGGALRRATSTTADFPVALAVKDLHLTHDEPAGRPVVAATLRLLEALPDHTADLATLINPA